ncbi:MAG: glutamine synthetase family protein, partial [Acutalibacteraceae bacterium]
TINGFKNEDSTDLLLVPDPTTLKVLAWRPQQGRVVRLFCDIKNQDGTPFEGDVRNILKKAVEKTEEMGFRCKVGLACEFYLFKSDDDGYPTRIPQDNAGYLDVAPLDKGENVRRQICLTLEQMEIEPLSSHHENGPGQNEIDFKHSDLLSAADNLMTFKTVVKNTAAANGLYASFMPKPLMDKSGSGMHIDILLEKYGFNIFKNKGEGLSDDAKSFIAGVLRRSAEMTVFFNPLSNSYARFGMYEAPCGIDWSYNSLDTLIRLPEMKRNSARMEYRSPDPSCNPYIAFALLIYAGLEGIEEKLELCPPSDVKSSDDSSPHLPESLAKAISIAKKSDFIKEHLPKMIFDNYISIKSEEVNCSLQSAELRQQQEDRYFEII